MNERTIETAKNALGWIYMCLNDYTDPDERRDAVMAWYRLKNFVDLVEKETPKG